MKRAFDNKREMNRFEPLASQKMIFGTEMMYNLEVTLETIGKEKVMGKRLDGQTAIVTGAGRGIGLAIARELAATGANIVINYVTSAGCCQ